MNCLIQLASGKDLQEQSEALNKIISYWSNGRIKNRVHTFQSVACSDTHSLFCLQCCAVAFIEKLDAQSLNLSQEDFDRFMTGQTSPKKQESDSFSPDVCLGVKQMYKNLDLLSQLNEKQERIVNEAKKLEKDLIDWTDGITKEVQDIVEKYPLEIKPKSQALAAIDSENVENDKLPPPLQPQVYAG